MPSFKTAGKSKEDLAVVVQLAGLLGPEDTAGMTRAELVKVIEAANKKMKNDEGSAAAVQVGDPAAADIAPEQETQEKTPAKKPRAARTRKAASGSGKAAEKAQEEGGRASKAELNDQAETNSKAAKAEDKEDAKPASARRRRKTATAADDSAKAASPRKTRKKSPAQTTGENSRQAQIAVEEKAEAAKIAADSPEQEPEITTPGKNTGKSGGTGKKPAAATRKRTAGKKAVKGTEKTEKLPLEAAVSAIKTEPAGSAAEKIPEQEIKAAETVELSPEAAGAALDKKEAESGTEKERARPDKTDEAKTETAETKPAESDSGKTKRPYVETGEIQAGVLEIMPDGYGFLRKDNYLQGNKDIYVPPQYIRRFGLRAGDLVSGPVKLQRETDRYQALLYIKEVNGLPPEKMLRRPHFDRLTPIYPDTRYILETTRNELSTRIIDLVAPIGKGQRGMIVSPPKAGKTILLQKIANAISVNNPEAKLIVLLIDERPEEVTDMQRSINGEVVYSTFDKTPENHTKVVELVLERAMRLVELKQDVVILLDSMTRLARAYNLTINPTGRTLSGGLDPGALYGPKRFFGAARNIENGGSLTIIATSLIETGSRMDEVIFEEFKGTGNMEVYLDRKLSEKRIFPAIDINKSGTRREELLLTPKELDSVWTIRKAFSQLDTSAVTEAIINLLLKTQNNEHFIASINVSFNDKNIFEAMRGGRPGTGGAANQPAKNGNYNSTGYSSNYRRYGSSDDD